MIEHTVSGCSCTGKYCPRCRQTRCCHAFNHNSRSKDGLYTYCKICHAASSKSYEEEHREERREARRRRYQDNPRYREYNAAYYQANKERYGEYARASRERDMEHYREVKRLYGEKHPDMHKLYYRANPDRYRERIGAYQRRNLERYAIYTANRYARKKSAGGSITLEQWEELKRYYNYTCLRCGRQEPEIVLTMDHVIPITRGGINAIENIQPLCGSCNSSKGTQIIDYRV
jgi:5-methylcytosine-specific restriction endonuclease McrA